MRAETNFKSEVVNSRMRGNISNLEDWKLNPDTFRVFFFVFFFKYLYILDIDTNN